MPANVSQMLKMEAPSPIVTAIASPPTSVSPHDLRSMRRPSLPSSKNVSSHGRPRAARAASRNCVTPPSSSRASAARLVRAHAAAHLLVFRHRQVRFELLVEIGVACGGTNELAETRHQRVEQRSHVSVPTVRLQDAADDAGNALPVLGLRFQLRPSGFRDRVELRLAIVLGRAPF